MPVGDLLERMSAIQKRVFGEIIANELHPDRKSFTRFTGGNGDTRYPGDVRRNRKNPPALLLVVFHNHPRLLFLKVGVPDVRYFKHVLHRIPEVERFVCLAHAGPGGTQKETQHPH